MRLPRSISRLAVGLAACMAMASAQAVPVALELSLVIDVSGSVSDTEYALQRDGYKAAFLDASVQSAILSHAGSGGVAVNVIQFASSAVHSIAWTLLDDLGDITAFAAVLGAMGQSGAVGTGTDIAAGMLLARNSIAGNAYEGTRKVIDVSGDGHQSDSGVACSGVSPYNVACSFTRAQRDAAEADLITVNGLAIEGAYGTSGLNTWYTTNVKTSDGFVISAASFDDFERAAIAKIGREVGVPTGLPEPGSLALVALALGGAGWIRRRAAR